MCFEKYYHTQNSTLLPQRAQFEASNTYEPSELSCKIWQDHTFLQNSTNKSNSQGAKKRKKFSVYYTFLNCINLIKQGAWISQQSMHLHCWVKAHDHSRRHRFLLHPHLLLLQSEPSLATSVRKLEIFCAIQNASSHFSIINWNDKILDKPKSSNRIWKMYYKNLKLISGKKKILILWTNTALSSTNKHRKHILLINK